MRELRFHRDLYAGEQVDAALKVYERFGTFTTSEEGEHFVVRVESKSAARERRLAGELANYALGLTIRGRGAT
ncbi:MAG: hypothetical protein GXP55_10115 [Deltaproteobacteria bacterium]|nr:hypothetical protein [Deltaproteobacteria bacterium]